MDNTKAYTGSDSSRDKVSPYFQTIAIIFAASVLAIGFYVRLQYYRTVDDPIFYQTLTPQKLREFGGSPEYIDVGLHIERFQEFDVIKNRFQFTGSVWFEFEAGAVSIETLQNFSFDRATIVYQSEPDTSLFGTRMMLRYVVRVAFNTGLSYADFPLDDHQVNLLLTHPFLSPEEVVFDTKTTDFTYEGNLLPFGWNVVGRSVKSGFTYANLSEQSKGKIIQQPVVGFAINVERYGARYALAILLPILLIYFIMFFSLTVETNPSVTIALGGITGILAYRYVIEQLSPMSGDLMLSDHFFFLFLSSSMLVFLLNIIDLFVFPLAMNKKKVGILFVHLFTLAVSIYFLAT